MSSVKYTILCVDDNENNLFTLKSLFEDNSDISTVLALGAQEALKILLKQKVDLVLLDIQMPDINGFELAKMIKSNKKTKDIPIIFLTAFFKSEEFIREGYELGAIDYLTKPIDDHQLLNKVSLYLKIFQEKNKLKQSEKRFYDIAQSIGDGIYTLNLKKELTFINDEALKMLGYKKKDLLGKKIHDIIHYKDRDNQSIEPNDCKIHHTMLIGERYSSNDELLMKKDGTLVPVSIMSVPLYEDSNIVGVVAVFHDNTKQNRIRKLEDEKLKNQEQIIHSMIDMIEARDSYTAGHTKRVAKYCELIAKEMDYSKNDIELLKNAAWLHDIGKISTPDSVLLKPGKLDDNEYFLIKDHLTSGYEMLNKIDQYKEIAEIMHEHHEKYNGTGYPNGLKAQEIKPLSRIMIVADAFDAMTTNRVYKPRKTIAVALDELQELSAKHFHPEVVSAAVVALKDIEIDNDISQLPQTIMEQQRFSYFYKDRLTNLFIMEYLNLLIRYHIRSESVYTYEIKLHNFSNYNKQYGWNKGDLFLIDFANYLLAIDGENLVFRVEGDDFMIISEKNISDLGETIQQYPNFQNSIVSCSVKQRYVEDVTSLISG